MPGHATIHTGAAPAVGGVASNRVWHCEKGKKIEAIDDRKHDVLGVEGEHAGHGLCKAETLADALGRHTAGRGKIVPVSLQDRAAVVGGGQQPRLALRYERKLTGFTTSTFYQQALPPCLEAFRKANPREIAAGALGA